MGRSLSITLVAVFISSTALAAPKKKQPPPPPPASEPASAPMPPLPPPPPPAPAVQEPAAPVQEVKAEAAQASSRPLHADLLGGKTLGSGAGLRMQINGGQSIIRGTFGLEADLLFALTNKVDLGATARASFYPYMAVTPGLKLRANVFDNQKVDLGVEVTAAAPLLFGFAYGFSPGILVEPGIVGSYQFNESNRFIFGLAAQPVVLFNYSPSRIGILLGIDPRIGFAHALSGGTDLFLVVDVIPTIDFTPVPNPRVPLIAVNASVGASFGM